MKKVVTGILVSVCIAIAVIFCVHKLNVTARESVRASLNSEVARINNESVVIKTSTDKLEFKNAEIFYSSYDGEILGTVNILNYRKDFTKYLQYSIRDSGFNNICSRIRGSSDYYYFEESISKNLELISTAKEKDFDADGLRQDLSVSAELNLSDYLSYEPPDNESVEKEYMDICDLKGWSIRYDNSLKLSWEDIEPAVSYKNGVVIDSAIYETLVDKVASSFDTVGSTRSIKIDGKQENVSGGTYGWIVDKEAEKEFIEKSIENRECVDERVPAFTKQAYSKQYGKRDIGSNYVLVDISEQHVWYYKNGKSVKDSDCVTGTLGIHDTPLGAYSIMEILPNGKVLRGDDYETPVNKWIRLTNTGIGLHDANWRRNFGSTIYKSNGSHGCINLPYDFADYLCKHVKIGMPVIIIE